MDRWATEDLAARGAMLSGYLAWRGAAPIISQFFASLLLLLPLALVGMLSDAVGLVNRPQHWRRHAAGTAGLLALFFILWVVITKVLPLQGALAGAAVPLDAASAFTLRYWHGVMVELNLFMLVLPAVKLAADAADRKALGPLASAASAGAPASAKTE